VNVKEASYTNSIGSPYLTAYWRDPAFDAKQLAFYYVRVLEIPTPRWTTVRAEATRETSMTVWTSRKESFPKTRVAQHSR
jgi:hypothetical protein